MNRRSLLLGLGASLAAPSIVRASSIMPVRSVLIDPVTNGPILPVHWSRMFRVVMHYEWDEHSTVMRGGLTASRKKIGAR